VEEAADSGHGCNAGFSAVLISGKGSRLPETVWQSLADAIDVTEISRIDLGEASNHIPDIAFIDIDAVESQELDALEALRNSLLGLPVLAVTARDDARIWRQCYMRGADFVITAKNGVAQVGEQNDAIRALMRNCTYFHGQEMWRILNLFENSQLLASPFGDKLAEFWSIPRTDRADSSSLVHSESCSLARQALYQYLSACRSNFNRSAVRAFYLTVTQAIEQVVSAINIAQGEDPLARGLYERLTRLRTNAKVGLVFDDIRELAVTKKNRILYHPDRVHLAPKNFSRDFAILIDGLTRLEGCLYTYLEEHRMPHASRWHHYRAQCEALGLPKYRLTDFDELFENISADLLKSQRETNDGLEEQLQALQDGKVNAESRLGALRHAQEAFYAQGTTRRFSHEEEIIELQNQLNEFDVQAIQLAPRLAVCKSGLVVAEAALQRAERVLRVEVAGALLRFEGDMLTRSAVVDRLSALVRPLGAC
jgi:CheY-like chemotaxis protein